MCLVCLVCLVSTKVISRSQARERQTLSRTTTSSEAFACIPASPWSHEYFVLIQCVENIFLQAKRKMQAADSERISKSQKKYTTAIPSHKRNTQRQSRGEKQAALERRIDSRQGLFPQGQEIMTHDLCPETARHSVLWPVIKVPS